MAVDTRITRELAGSRSAAARTGVPLRRAAGVTFAALVLAGLLNADTLDQHAQRLAFGWKHDAATAVTTRIRDVSHALLLDRPRRALDDLLGRAHATPDRPKPGPQPMPTGSPQPSTRPTPTPTETVSPANPLRVLVAGDSVSRELGQQLVKLAGPDPLVAASAEFRYSSGLTRPDYFDWRAWLRDAMSQGRPPQAVVVLFGANDAQGILTDSGAARFGSTDWIREYRSRVAAVMDELVRSGARVFWVGQPIMRPTSYDKRMQLLDEIYRSEAARHAGVSYIDTRVLFSDADGHYAARLPDGSGKEVLMRAPDGIHLSAAGGRRMASFVLQHIREQWEL